MDSKDSRDFDELWRRALAGNEAAWTEIWNELTPLLYGYALRLTNGDKRWSEELVGDVLAEAFVRRAKIESVSHLKAWTFLVLRRNFLNELRRRKRRGEVGLADDRSNDDFIDLLEKLIADQRLEKLSHCVEQLTPDEQRLVYWRFSKRESVAKICEKLGIDRHRYFRLIQKILHKLLSCIGFS